MNPMSNQTEIACPACAGKIFVDAAMLLQGHSFRCTSQGCDAAVSLSQSSYDVTENALNKLNEAKSLNMST